MLKEPGNAWKGNGEFLIPNFGDFLEKIGLHSDEKRSALDAIEYQFLSSKLAFRGKKCEGRGSIPLVGRKKWYLDPFYLFFSQIFLFRWALKRVVVVFRHDLRCLHSFRPPKYRLVISI
jgi:hypothetical protein